MKEVISLHHTSVSSLQPQYQVVEDYHKGLYNMPSSLGKFCCYNYFIERDGKVIKARADEDEGCHTIGWNKKSIGVCLSGNFSSEFPTKPQIDAVNELTRKYQLPVKFHRSLQVNRTCPGSNLIIEKIFEYGDNPPAALDDETKKNEE